MITGKSYGSSMPLTTINPSKIGAQATDAFDIMWRPMQWLGGETEENFQRLENQENEYALYTLLMSQKGEDLTNPVAWWRVENRLALNTRLTVAMSAADTYINVAEPGLLRAGYTLYLPQSNQQVQVVAVDPTYANSWTNGASDACNVWISRTTLPGPTGIAAAANSEVRPGPPTMGELGEPKEGIFTTPGDPLYNMVQFFGLYISISNVQRNSLMAGDYGTHQKLVRENESALARVVQNLLIFGHRGSYNDADEGQVYMTNGLINQFQSNVLSVSGVGNSLTFSNISEFIDQTFESANSGSTKTVVCGERLFMNILNTAKQEGAIVDDMSMSPDLGVPTFSFTTAGGRSVTVNKMRFAFEGELADWGLVLDLSNISTHEYAGFGWKWVFDLENPLQAITKKTDAMIGSVMLVVKDPDTCGVIRGGVEPLLVNRNGLGIDLTV